MKTINFLYKDRSYYRILGLFLFALLFAANVHAASIESINVVGDGDAVMIETSEDVKYTVTNVESLLSEIFKNFLRAELERENIETEVLVDQDLPETDMDQSRIEQVIVNLISNARHALENQKNPRIEVRAEKANESLRLTVKDNGTGIPEEYLDKVLNPFFTTKPVGKGTGIGLSVSLNIIKDHSGHIEIKNNKEGGASITVVLPFRRPTEPHHDSARDAFMKIGS